MTQALAFQTKGIIEEYQEYGSDARFWCDVASLVASVVMLYPPAAAFALALNLVLSFGVCPKFDHDKKSKQETDPSEEDIKKHQDITWEQITPEDKKTLKDKKIVLFNDNERSIVF